MLEAYFTFMAFLAFLVIGSMVIFNGGKDR